MMFWRTSKQRRLERLKHQKIKRRWNPANWQRLQPANIQQLSRTFRISLKFFLSWWCFLLANIETTAIRATRTSENEKMISKLTQSSKIYQRAENVRRENFIYRSPKAQIIKVALIRCCWYFREIFSHPYSRLPFSRIARNAGPLIAHLS